MRRAAGLATLLCLAALALPGHAQQGNFRLQRDRELNLRPIAEPGTVVATELAFARMAREMGTWTAFLEYSTDDAVMPAPNFRKVHEVLKGRPDPAEAIVWEPDMVWVSCNGQYALSTGPADYPGGGRGRFATIWQRQDDGEYRWVLDQGFDLEDDYVAPELIKADVAQCPPGRPVPRDATAQGDHSSGLSDDGSFAWRTTMSADCAREFVVEVLRDGALVEVFRRAAAAPEVPEGRDPITCDAP